ncbi:ABC transporter substrate-binding protein [Leucobacter chromiireducens]|uniref:ABC transporter substrate-binding protein n=1 Tax=Leucobacter chromiireducens subsp. chromiireducens TaxID=660067 RepID=A0ABS1SL74_9MICO|nr:ABC transporter substrate-binding protein [Leucobacter chromiireducens]MBL3688355.1 ABC transporter substrate-binding protein [Leucobacter chromiireducens subsp. chromiireducens]
MARTRFQTRALGVAGLAAAAALVLSGCTSGSGDQGGGDADSVTIGISQFVQHPALDAAAEGFKQAFIDAGYVEGETVTFDVKNANAEVATATTIAQTFASDGVDLALAIATPSAQAAAQNLTDIPVLFTAVTDAVAADLVESNEKPGGNVTGTSDLSPVADQIDLITEIKPDTKKIGMVYGSGEVNSQVQVELAREAAKKHGIEVVEATVTNASELMQATESLGDVDAIYTPSDNLVASGIGAIVGVAEDKGILVVGSDSTHVEGGAAATVGIDYTKLGKQTGEMAIRILKDGADPATMPVETSKDLELTINPDAAKRLGVTLPDALVERAANVVK